MAWRRPGDKPLSEPMMASSPTHICVTRPQWVNLFAIRLYWAAKINHLVFFAALPVYKYYEFIRMFFYSSRCQIFLYDFHSTFLVIWGIQLIILTITLNAALSFFFYVSQNNVLKKISDLTMISDVASPMLTPAATSLRNPEMSAKFSHHNTIKLLSNWIYIIPVTYD